MSREENMLINKKTGTSKSNNPYKNTKTLSITLTQDKSSNNKTHKSNLRSNYPVLNPLVFCFSTTTQDKE